jgi:hypothetical protein
MLAPTRAPLNNTPNHPLMVGGQKFVDKKKRTISSEICALTFRIFYKRTAQLRGDYNWYDISCNGFYFIFFITWW